MPTFCLNTFEKLNAVWMSRKSVKYYTFCGKPVDIHLNWFYLDQKLLPIDISNCLKSCLVDCTCKNEVMFCRSDLFCIPLIKSNRVVHIIKRSKIISCKCWPRLRPKWYGVACVTVLLRPHVMQVKLYILA